MRSCFDLNRSIAPAGAYMALHVGPVQMQQRCIIQLCHGHAVMIFGHDNGPWTMGIDMTCDHVVLVVSSVEFFPFQSNSILVPRACIHIDFYYSRSLSIDMGIFLMPGFYRTLQILALRLPKQIYTYSAIPVTDS